MPVRRGEVPFVAVPLGRLDDPREVIDLADALKIHPAQALGYLVRLDAFVLKFGDAYTGKVKGYTSRHLAVELGHEGKPDKLVAALKKIKVLSVHRGTIGIVAWRESITGQYAARKAQDRDDWARQKVAQRAAARASALAAAGAPVVHPDVHPVSTWTGGGHPPAVHLDGGQKERKGQGRTDPPDPPLTRGELASRRWAEIDKTARNPNNPEGCKKFAERISEAEWAQCIWVLQGCPGGASRSSSRKTRILDRGAYEILRSGDWRRFRGEWEEKLRQDARPKNGHARPPAPPPDAAADEAERKAAALLFVLHALADADVPTKKKAKIRAEYEAAHGPIPEESLLPPAPAAN